MKYKGRLIITLLCVMVISAGCVTTKITVFREYSEPLQEFVLEGEAEGKVLIIPVRGMISADEKEKLLYTEPGIVQEVVSHLDLASRDAKVKAVVMLIDSPGGSVTASDILYHEIESFRKKTGKKVVTALMNLATSGAYYAALAGDRIYAHPTTVTGSIGVIFIRPQVKGLMDKIGVEAEVTKSGMHKDMGSPFRETTEAEQALFQQIIDEMYGRFAGLVAARRGIDAEKVRDIADGRIYTAQQAFDLKLVDQVGYIDDAVAGAKLIAGLPDNAKVVVYRRSQNANDNFYNTVTAEGGGTPKLVDLDIPGYGNARAGFYYLWAPGMR